MKENETLLFKYVRGSQLYGTAVEGSDTDTASVYIGSLDDCLTGTLAEFHHIGKGDDDEMELGKFIRQCGQGKPNSLEALFANDEFVEYCHPVFKKLREQRDKFITKPIFDALLGFSHSQIHKAKGLNKKINIEPMEKKPSMYDFMYVAYEQGSVPLKEWLQTNILHIKFKDGIAYAENLQPTTIKRTKDYKIVETYDCCYPMYERLNQETDGTAEAEQMVDEYLQTLGITSVPNMQFVYNVYAFSSLDRESRKDHKGFISPDGNQLIYSSVEKGTKCLCRMHYDYNKYSTACRQYKEYQEWLQNRNETRYLGNAGKGYDGKSMLHCIRMMYMAEELATEGKLNFNRRGKDADLLIAIRQHKFELDELIQMADEIEARVRKALETTNIPDHVDWDFVKKMHLEMRYGLYFPNKPVKLETQSTTPETERKLVENNKKGKDSNQTDTEWGYQYASWSYKDHWD